MIINVTLWQMYAKRISNDTAQQGNSCMLPKEISLLSRSNTLVYHVFVCCAVQKTSVMSSNCCSNGTQSSYTAIPPEETRVWQSQVKGLQVHYIRMQKEWCVHTELLAVMPGCLQNLVLCQGLS